MERINAGIGHIKICDIRPQHLNALYEQLGQQGLRKSAEKAILKPDVSLSEMIHEMGYTKVEKFLKESAHLSVATYRNAVNGKPIAIESARKISLAINTDMKKLFTEEVDTRPLSPKTIREHHALIHMILRQAEQELLVPLGFMLTNPRQKNLSAG